MTRDRIISLSQKAYGICLVCFGIQQLALGHISPNFLPLAFSENTIYHVAIYPWGICFTLFGVAVLANWKAREVALISGGVFLTLLMFVYLPYLSFFHPRRGILFEWAPAIQEVAFVGASFILANSFKGESQSSGSLIRFLEKISPYGRIFFSLELILYGFFHFVYPDGVATLVPGWIPFPIFWTYFAGVALIGAGLSIILRFKIRLVAILLAIMIFSWFLILHIPRAIDNPTGLGGLELTRVFVSFGFTGIALLIAYNE